MESFIAFTGVLWDFAKNMECDHWCEIHRMQPISPVCIHMH